MRGRKAVQVVFVSVFWSPESESESESVLSVLLLMADLNSLIAWPIPLPTCGS